MAAPIEREPPVTRATLPARGLDRVVIVFTPGVWAGGNVTCLFAHD
jgi:hypothetical protein